MVDIYHSRRTHYKKCDYWCRYEKGDPSVYALNNAPDGSFYAKEVSEGQLRNNIITNGFLFSAESVTILTTDNPKIQVGNLIMYLGHIWYVNGISTMIHQKESEFGKPEYDLYINLRR